IQQSGKMLLTMINDILDLAKIEAGKMEVRAEDFSIRDVLESLAQTVRPMADRKSIDLDVEIDDAIPLLRQDASKIRQIVFNLLSNAIKFTPQGGEIWIKVGWTASGGQYFSVKDTGPGIPENEIPIVLASFGQGSNAIKSAEQGAGLGLPIAKSLVDLHGGSFTLKSKLRVGTEVVVAFPPERVMSALPPLTEPAPPTQPQGENPSAGVGGRNGRPKTRSTGA
ncbi:MAG: HAMP domain-containing histidine kinase, partial [Pseudorhodoplanes sp.]|nr:HAMP domain-containing histidine kinase [Pseudorhodoplanes sp.]